MLLAHGLRSDAISDDRSWPLRTPNLERLGQQGLRLVAASACPTDQGGWVSLLTGLHPRQHGLLADTPRVRLIDALPAWFAQAGYHVAGVGCVGMMEPLLHEAVAVEDVSVPEPARCAYWSAMQKQGLTDALARQRRQRLRSGPFEPDRLLIEPEQDIDGFIARQAAAALERMPTDRPWLLVVVFSGPGNDLPPPPLYEQIVNPAHVRHGFTPADLTQLDALAEPVYPRVMLQRLEPYAIGRIRADYLARVSMIDYSVGRLAAVLARRPDQGRTWTMLSSDRGYLLGEHGLIGHRSFLAGALEVPLVVTPPANGSPLLAHTAEGLISTIDVAATAAAIGGCDLPPAVAGRSLLPLFQVDAVLPDPPGGNLSEFNDRLLLETDRYKAVFNTATRVCLGLYDMLADPHERNNLLQTMEGVNLLDALRSRLSEALLPLRAAGGAAVNGSHT
ncbi:MAG TPA: sulfatase-like hydrolase/transferase [Phycisphaeraceae bacterium]